MRRLLLRSKRPEMWLAAALMALIWLGASAKIRQDERLAFQSAQVVVQNTARLIEQNAIQSIRALDNALLYLRSQHGNERATFSLADTARRWSLVTNLTVQMAHIGPDGMMLETTVQPAPQAPIDLKDREHFLAHANTTQDRLFISRPMLGRASHKKSVQLSRRISGPGGEFAGVFVVSLDPNALSSFYRSIDLGADALIALVGDDGVVRATSNTSALALGQSLEGAATGSAGSSNSQLAAATANGAILTDDKGVRRLVAKIDVDALPLFVVAGMSEQKIYADFYYSEVYATLATGSCLTLLVVGLMIAVRGKQRQQRMQSFRRNRERRLLARNTELAALNRTKSQFLATMSHEIRTPMNGVLGMADLLMRTALTDRQQHLAGSIQHSAKSLLSIINDILDVSRIEVGKLTLEQQPFAPGIVLQDTVDLLAREAHRKGIELSLSMPSDMPEIALGDAGRLRQVCMNIVANAIKFTQAGEVAVKVSVAPPLDRLQVVTVEVRDTGIGIAPEDQARLFKPFEQADATIARRFGGSGLGLSIAKHLVDAMGGMIALASEVGQGTTLSVSLPLARPATSADVEAGISATAPLEGLRLLLLDRHATSREIIAAYLKDAGAAVTIAQTSEDAIQALRAAVAAGAAFHAAIIDTGAGDTDRADLAMRIKLDATLGAPRLLLSTGAGADDTATSSAPADAVLHKPIHRQALLAAVIGERPPAAAKAVTPTVTSLRAKKIKALLAEDNPVNMEVAREYLVDLGCDVTVVENGADAVAACAAGTFDIVFMDCLMPVMDGLTAVQLIRAAEHATHQPRTPIVALTADAFAHQCAECLAAGMDAVVSKPCTQDDIGATLERWVMPVSLLAAA